MICLYCADAEGLCGVCGGEGTLVTFPYAERRWDEIVPGLWQGGHFCWETEENPHGEAIPTHEFDLVVSLYRRPGFGPDLGIPHIWHRMPDAPLEAKHHEALDRLATLVAAAVKSGKRVLVRCQAGLNRSGLVVGLAMIKMGWEPEAAIERIREARSPYALCNRSFVEHLMEKEYVG